MKSILVTVFLLLAPAQVLANYPVKLCCGPGTQGRDKDPPFNCENHSGSMLCCVNADKADPQDKCKVGMDAHRLAVAGLENPERRGHDTCRYTVGRDPVHGFRWCAKTGSSW
ncbi:hypothetical protein COCMIDRAFT_27613 [Bipolaris oryzae ATCC 44560]|uniref:Hydrophobin n=1 Tax=Bipolaris oryzae ATCC 44560 TaxID=930090 RepID=W6YX83_COCMI|nr:uncharacterized protein COCMIDRAFT_27613 [Bipolaris oryzae ATCC 44560]EUC44007.1 hypothetical protein COCMIDRAFT_27613 [Bipolaris oryzae ATCC 44560]